MQEPKFLHANISTAAAKNRRKSPRHPSPVTQVTVVAGDAKRQATIIDESPDGIGVAISGPMAVFIDQQIELVYQGVPARAVVRWVQGQEGGQCRIGLEWVHSEHKMHSLKPHTTLHPPLDAVDAVFHELDQLLS